MEIDFLIIGQGLAGSALGYRLIQEGKKVILIDQPVGIKVAVWLQAYSTRLREGKW